MDSVVTGTDLDRAIAQSKQEEAEFAKRVRAEEESAKRNPRAHRRKIVKLVAVAYTYIFSILIIALLMLAGVIYFMIEAGSGNFALLKLALLLGIFTFALLRSLWVEIKLPEGVVLSRKDAPDLYREANSIADRLKAPRPNDIRIDWRLNARASQTPRLGIFGFYRNTLILGLPLLMSLTPDEARAVIAHEFGHFSGAHGKFGAWVYRISRTWEQIESQFAGRGGRGGFIFAGFVKWFQPRFEATTFALRRANEYEADRAAADIAGAANAGRGLMRLTFISHHLDKAFWGPLTDQAKMLPAPPDGFLGPMADIARSMPDKDMIEVQLANAFAMPTDYDDTHPSLTDRLKALGCLPSSTEEAVADVSKPIGQSAAEALFGDALPSITAKVESHFASSVKEGWAKTFKTSQEHIGALKTLRQRASAGPLSESDQLDLAYHAYHAEGTATAEPLFRAVHEAYPQNSVAMYWLGQCLSDRADLSAEPLLKEAMAQNPKLTQSVLGALAQLYWETGEHEKYAELRGEATERMMSRQIVETIARNLALTDHFEPHDLSEDSLSRLIGAIRKVPKLDVAYLVNKVLPTGEKRLTLIAFHRRKGLEREGEPQLLMLELLKVDEMPEGTLIFAPSDRKRWTERLDSIPGARIFSHPD